MEKKLRSSSQRLSLSPFGAAMAALLLIAAATLLSNSRWSSSDHEEILPWPGEAEAVAVQAEELDGENVSGLEYESDASGSVVLWAVRNDPSVLYKLTRAGDAWQPAGSDWAGGRTLVYPDGEGVPDSEALTLAGSGPERRVYVATERDNLAPEESSLKILRFDPSAMPLGSSTRLTAEQDWDLTGQPGLRSEPNTGFEGIAYVPDDVLQSHRFRDESTGDLYDPDDYGDHGDGAFFLGLEETGMVYGFILSLDGSSRRIATIDTGMPMVAELEFDADSAALWALCDNVCDGESTLMSFVANGSFIGTQLVPTVWYGRPASMPNLNNEGFTITARTECSDGSRPVYWTDDDATDHVTLREGRLGCS